MEKCKFCGADLEENNAVCPMCGKNNSEEETVTPAVEVENEAAESEEKAEAVSESEEKAVEAPAAEPEKKGILLTPGKLAAVIAVFVILLAVIIALVLTGKKTGPVVGETVTEPLETLATEPPTVPADGNPDDVTCKGSYTASDADVLAAADAVVATAGDAELTNADVQIMYWSEVWQFLSQYGSYTSYFGMDPAQSLDTQTSSVVEGWTWQQVFLDNAIRRWHESKALAMEAEENGFRLDEDSQTALDNVVDELEALAAMNEAGTAADLLVSRMGAGATTDAYKRFQESQYVGYGYFSDSYSKLDFSDADVEAYFNDHASAYEEQGVTKDTCTVDVRHILVYPEGATAETVRTEEFSDEAWAAGEANAQKILDQWLAGDKTEDAFAALANENSQDPGSNTNGGLYQEVAQGQMVEEFDAWCFDPARQIGDTGIVKTMFGYHIMYFSGSQTVWQETARADLLAEKADAIASEIIAKYPLHVDYSKIVLGNVTIG